MEREKESFFLTGHIQYKQSLSPRSLELRENFQTHRWLHIWEDTENRVISHTPGLYPYKGKISEYVMNINFHRNVCLFDGCCCL
jgi:hypothetical protein